MLSFFAKMVSNMKDYSKMSDFEIDKAVSTALGMDVSGATEENNIMYGYVDDICNNPSDAWPIMDEHKIGLTFVNGEWRASSVKAGYHEFSDAKAFRAAMIVYLMMKDEEK